MSKGGILRFHNGRAWEPVNVNCLRFIQIPPEPRAPAVLIFPSGPLERAQLANQIQGFRIPDHSDAWENNKFFICFKI